MRMRLRAEQDWKIDHNGKCDTKSLWNKANQEGKLNCSIIVFLFVAGPESVPPSLLKVVMKPIATVGENYQYPPVNWASVLSPLMRLNFGKHQVFLGLWSLILGCDLDRKIYPLPGGTDLGDRPSGFWSLASLMGPLDYFHWSLCKQLRTKRWRSEDTHAERCTHQDNTWLRCAWC